MNPVLCPVSSALLLNQSNNFEQNKLLNEIKYKQQQPGCKHTYIYWSKDALLVEVTNISV